MFSQADNSTTRKFGGIGINLLVSNLLARLMGSEIKLESEIGKGSIFSFTILANYNVDREMAGDKPASVKWVLMNDDNTKRRLAVSQLVNELNIEFLGVDDWLSAIHMLETSNPFDAILVENTLSNLNGEDVIRMIRRNLSFASEEMPFVLLCSPADKLKIRKSNNFSSLIADLCERENPKELRRCLRNLNLEPDLQGADESTPGKESPQNLNVASPVILVAEDVFANMMLITIVLEIKIPQVTILKAVNGREACELAIDKKPDLILMDIQMPEMSGIEATLEIRKFEKLNGGHIPIVALTSGFDMQACIESGMDEFMTKPFSPDKLDLLLSKYLKGLLTA